MTFLLSLFLLLNTQSAVAAPLQAFAVVKVESRFRAGSENKLEGSGLLFRKNGALYVVTSEHVVIPSNEGTAHRVRNNFNVDFEASWERSSWEKGLALLKLKVRDSEIFKEVAPAIEEIEAAENPPLVAAFGYPAAVNEFRHFSDGKPAGLHPAGTVLFGTAVTAIRDTQVEFGMSGGPALAQKGRLAGIITHITYEDDPLAFLIPAREVLAWVKGGDSGAFTRNVADFRNQSFSRSKPEAVTHVASDLRIEKRNGKFLVIMNGQYSYHQGLDDLPGLLALLHALRSRYTRIAELQGIDPKLTLAQLVATFRNPIVPAFRDYEGNDNGDLTPVPAFYPKAGQRAVFDVLKDGKRGTRTITLVGEYPNFDYEEKVEGPAEIEPGMYIGAHSADHWRDRRAQCGLQFSGVPEVIEVPAGKFHTCHVTTPLIEFWYGPVPGKGIVKIRYLDGSHTEELRSAKYE